MKETDKGINGRAYKKRPVRELARQRQTDAASHGGRAPAGITLSARAGDQPSGDANDKEKGPSEPPAHGERPHARRNANTSSSSGGGAVPPARGADPAAESPLPTPLKSILWLLLLIGVYLLGAGLVGGVYGFLVGAAEADFAAESPEVNEQMLNFMFSPTGMAWTTGVQAALIIPLLLWASHFKHQPWHETLAFKPVPVRSVLFWLAVLLGFLVLQSVITAWLDPETGDLMAQVSAAPHLGLALALAVIAPVVEELIFRGYLFAAWRHSRLGLWGTLLTTSVLFAFLHASQYPLLILVYLFVLSVILGLARERTGSVLMPMLMHMANNLVAVIGLMFLMGA